MTELVCRPAFRVMDSRLLIARRGGMDAWMHRGGTDEITEPSVSEA